MHDVASLGNKKDYKFVVLFHLRVLAYIAKEMKDAMVVIIFSVSVVIFIHKEVKLSVVWGNTEACR